MSELIDTSARPVKASEMTLRDYFAAKAMQGFVASIGVVGGIAPTESDMARYSYELADAMIQEREK